MSNFERYRNTICRNKGCDDVQIAKCMAESGELKELIFCETDGLFLVKMDGKERLRTDMKSMAYSFFTNLGMR